MKKLLLGALAASGLALLTGCGDNATKTAAAPPPPTKFDVPDKGAYLGAYIEFGETEDDVTLEGIEGFEKEVGKHQAIIASSSYWGQQSFPWHSVDVTIRHGSIPLIFWSPWDKPYQQDRPPDQFSLQAIADGKWDAYIDEWADQAKLVGQPFLVAWGLEMNGTWFPWSGYYYGAGNKTSDGGSAGPELYIKAYRHVVDRVRARGAHNILWVFQTNNVSSPSEDWNTMKAYYPGDNYVDWLGMSAYGMQFHGTPWLTVDDTFTKAYDELCALNPTKPVIIAEWGIGDFPGSGDKAAWIREAFSQMQEKMPRLRASIFWHERWENEDGTFSNLRATSSVPSIEAYRAAAANPFWLEHPIYE